MFLFALLSFGLQSKAQSREGKAMLARRDSIIEAQLSHSFAHARGYIMAQMGWSSATGDDFNQPEQGFSSSDLSFSRFPSFGIGALAPLNEDFFTDMSFLFTQRGYALEGQISTTNPERKNTTQRVFDHRMQYHYLEYRGMIGLGLVEGLDFSTGIGVSLLLNKSILGNDVRVNVYDSTQSLITQFAVDKEEIARAESDFMDFLWCNRLYYSTQWGALGTPLSLYAGFSIDMFGLNIGQEGFATSRNTHYVFSGGVTFFFNWKPLGRELYMDEILG